jgi:hypothetical protein
MSDSDLFAAVAQKTGEDSHEFRRRGIALTGPDGTGPCLLDVMLADPPGTGTVDWDSLSHGSRARSATAGMPAFGRRATAGPRHAQARRGAARNVVRLHVPLGGSGGKQGRDGDPLPSSCESCQTRGVRPATAAAAAQPWAPLSTPTSTNALSPSRCLVHRRGGATSASSPWV